MNRADVLAEAARRAAARTEAMHQAEWRRHAAGMPKAKLTRIK